MLPGKPGQAGKLFGKLPVKTHWRQPKKDLYYAETLIGQWFEAKNKAVKKKKL